MQGTAFLVGEVIALIVSNHVDNRPVRQGCRFVENEAAFLNMGSERTHAATVRLSEQPSKHSRCPAKPVDLAEPGNDLVPTAWHSGRHFAAKKRGVLSFNIGATGPSQNQKPREFSDDSRRATLQTDRCGRFVGAKCDRGPTEKDLVCLARPSRLLATVG